VTQPLKYCRFRNSKRNSKECPKQSSNDQQRFSGLLAQIYSAVTELEKMFPGRHFTPDGQMVGSIGEAIAAYHYSILSRRVSSTELEASLSSQLRAPFSWI
jgi:hypothetical protein